MPNKKAPQLDGPAGNTLEKINRGLDYNLHVRVYFSIFLKSMTFRIKAWNASSSFSVSSLVRARTLLVSMSRLVFPAGWKCCTSPLSMSSIGYPNTFEIVQALLTDGYKFLLNIFWMVAAASPHSRESHIFDFPTRFNAISRFFK